MNKLILVVAILLASCATKPDAIVPPVEKKVHIDSSILEPCEPLPSLIKGYGSSFEDILLNDMTIMGLYAKCADKQKTSATLLRKFSNESNP